MHIVIFFKKNGKFIKKYPNFENSTFLILIEKKRYEFYEQRSKPTA